MVHILMLITMIRGIINKLHRICPITMYKYNVAHKNLTTVKCAAILFPATLPIAD